MTFRTFWLVWCYGGDAPTQVHMRENSAEQEAARLARRYPDKTFCVVEAKRAVCFASVVWRQAAKDAEMLDVPMGGFSEL